jgi:hypothetical protein
VSLKPLQVAVQALERCLSPDGEEDGEEDPGGEAALPAAHLLSLPDSSQAEQRDSSQAKPVQVRMPSWALSSGLASG